MTTETPTSTFERLGLVLMMVGFGFVAIPAVVGVLAIAWVCVSALLKAVFS